VHLAAAKAADVAAFLTVDDRLRKRAARHLRAVRIRVINPVVLLEEIARDINR
jgi:hypothetical protein